MQPLNKRHIVFEHVGVSLHQFIATATQVIISAVEVSGYIGFGPAGDQFEHQSAGGLLESAVVTEHRVDELLHVRVMRIHNIDHAAQVVSDFFTSSHLVLPFGCCDATVCRAIVQHGRLDCNPHVHRASATDWALFVVPLLFSLPFVAVHLVPCTFLRVCLPDVLTAPVVLISFARAAPAMRKEIPLRVIINVPDRGIILTAHLYNFNCKVWHFMLPLGCCAVALHRDWWNAS